MKNISDYFIPVMNRNDFLEYKKSHPSITVEEYINQGLCNTMAEYDYDKIVFDFWETGLYSGKLDMVEAIMSWSKGHLNLTLIIESFEKIIPNIDKCK